MDEGLSLERNEMVAQLMEVMNLTDRTRAIELLTRSDWNLVQAIEQMYNPRSFSDQPSTSSNNEVRRRFQHSSAATSSSFSTNTSPPPIRPRARPVRTVVAGGDSNILWSFFASIFSSAFSVLKFFYRLFIPDPRSTVVDAKSDVGKFIDDFHSLYPISPPFIRDTYSKAVGKAKSDIKFLMVYFHDETVPSAVKFCQDVLSSQEIKDTLAAKDMLIWGCSVQTPAGFTTHQKFSFGAAPVVAILAPVSSNKLVIGGICGPLSTPNDFLTLVERVVINLDDQLRAQRMKKHKINADRGIREEQERAYLKSLEEDKKKETERKAREELEKAKSDKKSLKLRERQRKREEHEERKRRCKQNASQEPSGSDDDVIKLRIVFLDGSKAARSFRSSDSVEVLHDYAYAHESSPRMLQLSHAFPRQAVSQSGTSYIDEHRGSDGGLPSLKEAGFVTMETVCVESTVTSDDEDTSSEDEE